MRGAQCTSDLVWFGCRRGCEIPSISLPLFLMAPHKVLPTAKGMSTKTTRSKTAKEHVKVNLDAPRILKAAHYRAENTRKNYQSALRTARSWLEEAIGNAKECSTADLDSIGCLGNSDSIPQPSNPFLHVDAPYAFSERTAVTPDLIVLYLTHRIMTEGKKKSTADTAHAAFKDQFTTP